MAVDKRLCLTQQYQDCSKFVISDVSEWGATSPDRRDDAARFLLAAKMDEVQTLEFIKDVDNSNPYSKLSWTINSAGIGAYRFFYIDLLLWDNTVSYVGEVVVDDVRTHYGHIMVYGGTYYKAIANSIGVEPGIYEGWENYWAEFDTNLLEQEVENPYLVIHIHDDIISCEYENCILDHLEEMTEKELCGGCCDSQDFMKLMKMQFMLDAAESANWQLKAPRADLILKEANKKFCC